MTGLRLRWRLAASAVLLSATAAIGEQSIPDARRVGSLKLTGPILEGADVSDAATSGPWMAVVSDELHTVQILKRVDGGYEADPKRDVKLGEGKQEFDLEGVAWGQDYVYTIGAHCVARKRVKSDKTAKKNTKRLYTTEDDPYRRKLCRFRVDDKGLLVPGSEECIDLGPILFEHKLLKQFKGIPSKENGIDIEGLAVEEDKRLFIGFRGPVLRGNYVPVLVLDISNGFEADADRVETLFVNLGGRGVRELFRMKSGRTLILGGPIGDGSASYRLYLWNGKDCVPGKDKPNALENVQALCTLPPHPKEKGAKPEGLTVLSVRGNTLRFLIIHDSADRGGPVIYECSLPTP